MAGTDASGNFDPSYPPGHPDHYVHDPEIALALGAFYDETPSITKAVDDEFREAGDLDLVVDLTDDEAIRLAIDPEAVGDKEEK